MIYLTPLILAHLAGDFLLQPDIMVQHKKKHRLRSHYLYIHVAIHGALAWSLTQNWFISITTLLTHLCIDAGKLFLTTTKNSRLIFLIDQLLHLSIIAGLVFLYNPDYIDLTLELLSNTQILNLVCSIVFLTIPASILIKTLISGWAPNVDHRNSSSDETPLMNAGKYIGMLERLFVFSFVVSQHFEAIGFLLAAKSIFRFGDLKDHKDRNLTEYVLIGTLLSFGLAIATGWLYATGTNYFNPK